MSDVSTQLSGGKDHDMFEEVFTHDTYYEYTPGYEDRYPVGAASFFLHSITQDSLPKAVLEGAPGQGKSTIAQYICQVHRMRLLGRGDLVGTLPKYHQANPVRLPFKVDLRDLSAWLAKKNPFSTDESETLPLFWHKSLESFLAAQVRFNSGGSEFDVDDLISVAKLSSILLVFDGLDEIARR
jgi:hypothetical protein